MLCPFWGKFECVSGGRGVGFFLGCERESEVEKRRGRKGAGPPSKRFRNTGDKLAFGGGGRS